MRARTFYDRNSFRVIIGELGEPHARMEEGCPLWAGGRWDVRVDGERANIVELRRLLKLFGGISHGGRRRARVGEMPKWYSCLAALKNSWLHSHCTDGIHLTATPQQPVDLKTACTC